MGGFAMQQAQPSPTAPSSSPARAPAGSDTTAITAYLVAALVGSGLMAVSSFLPWISYSSTSTWTGWEIFENRPDGGLFMANMFSRVRLSPMFTGPSTLILGALVAATAVAILVSMRRSPGAYTVPLTLVAAAHIVGVVTAVVPVINLASYVLYGEGMRISLEYGFALLVIGGIVSLFGLVRATRRPAVWTADAAPI
jgi:hypothetical protein